MIMVIFRPHRHLAGINQVSLENFAYFRNLKFFPCQFSLYSALGHHEFDPHGRHPGAHGSHPVSNYHPDRRSSYDRQYDNRLSHPQPVGTWPEHAPRRRPSGGHPDAFRGGPPVDRWAQSGHHNAHIDRRMSTSRDLDARSHDRREPPRHPRDRDRHYYDQNSRYRPY